MIFYLIYQTSHLWSLKITYWRLISIRICETDNNLFPSFTVFPLFIKIDNINNYNYKNVLDSILI